MVMWWQNLVFVYLSFYTLANAYPHLSIRYLFTTISPHQILELLKTKGMNAAGMIRVNRFNKPPLISDSEMKKKELGYSDQVTSLDVMTMLAIHQAAMETTLHLNSKIKITKAEPAYFV
jgi:hypothetical protein